VILWAQHGGDTEAAAFLEQCLLAEQPKEMIHRRPTLGSRPVISTRRFQQAAKCVDLDPGVHDKGKR
jgi:hypothetical protein